MTYKIMGLDPARFGFLVGLPDAELAAYGALRVVADRPHGFPCRVRLEDVAPGETLLLVNHVSHESDTPYRASHAIYVGERSTSPACWRDAVPAVLDSRLLSLRAFDAGGMMVDATLAQPGEADAAIRALLANGEVDHVDAHNAARGCFAARVERD